MKREKGIRKTEKLTDDPQGQAGQGLGRDRDAEALIPEMQAQKDHATDEQEEVDDGKDDPEQNQRDGCNQGVEGAKV